MSNRILLRGGAVMTVDPDVPDLMTGDVLIEDSSIAAVAPLLEGVDAEVVDVSGHIVMPGFIDTHRHTWQAPLRNFGSDWTLGQYMTGINLGLGPLYRPEDTYAATLLGALEALDGGITTLLDWSHNIDTPEHADAAIAALFETGGRGVFGHGGGARMWQLPGTAPHDRDVLRIRDQYFGSPDQLVTLAFAARGPQFASKEATIQDWQLARELGAPITVHAGDGEWGKSRPVAWMHEHGMVTSEVTFVHCNTLADDEIRMIADAGATASVSADIEAQMGHGWPATGRLLEAGVRPSLSIDVCTSNGGSMFGAMRTTINLQRALDNAAEEHPGEQESVRLSCADVVEFATLQGARACGLDAITGSLTPGKRADIITVRCDDLAMTPLNNPAGALVYSAHAGLVDHVLVDGRFVKRDGRLVGVDLARVRALATATRDRLVEGANNGTTALGAVTLGGGWRPATWRSPR